MLSSINSGDIKKTYTCRFKYGAPSRLGRRGRGWSTAEALRGLGGTKLQCLVRDLITAGRIGCNAKAAEEYRKLTGRVSHCILPERNMA